MEIRLINSTDSLSAAEVRELSDARQNACLKRLVADLTLDKHIL